MNFIDAIQQHPYVLFLPSAGVLVACLLAWLLPNDIENGPLGHLLGTDDMENQEG